MEATSGKQAVEKIKGLRLTATRLALFERKLGTPLTKLTDREMGLDATIKLLEAAGMTDDEIDAACDEMGLDEFVTAAMEVLFNSGLFSRAKQATQMDKAKAETK